MDFSKLKEFYINKDKLNANAGTGKNQSIELDVNEDFMNNMIQYCKKHGIMCNVLNNEGPAGNNPYVKFSADSKDKLQEMVKFYLGGDEADGEDYEFFIKDIYDDNDTQNNEEKINAARKTDDVSEEDVLSLIDKFKKQGLYK